VAGWLRNVEGKRRARWNTHARREAAATGRESAPTTDTHEPPTENADEADDTRGARPNKAHAPISNPRGLIGRAASRDRGWPAAIGRVPPPGAARPRRYSSSPSAICLHGHFYFAERRPGLPVSTACLTLLPFPARHVRSSS
jgi:hypothetical protein